MSKRYVVLGAGMQGVAAAYDFARFGEAEQLVLADADPDAAAQGAARINTLLGTELATAERVDVTRTQEVAALLQNATVCLSAVPYYFNFELSQAAVQAGCHFCDLGGNTDVVFQQHQLDEAAKQAGITIAPDCGLAPGMANILAAHGIRMLQGPARVHIRVGGLPQHPKPPLGYALLFNIEGLTNEYFGKAHIIREGKRTVVDTFSELEEIAFPEPYGKCEAFITAGGTSTCPWSFEGVVEEFEEKTIRYPGHYEKMKTVLDLGLLDLQPVTVKGQQVVPRDVFHAVVEPLLRSDDPRDVVLLRVIVDGKNERLEMELIDTYDPETGFTAMQRTTGFGAAMVGIMLAEGAFPPGTIRLEQQVDAEAYLAAMQARGFHVRTTRTQSHT